MFRSIVLSMVGSTTLLAAASQPQPFHRPVVFEPNRGQAPETVKWIARGSGVKLFITSDGVTMLVPGPSTAAQSRPAYSAVRMKLSGSRAWRSLTGLAPTGGVSNYLLGNDPGKWRTGIPQYASLKASGVYPGIDLVLYTHDDSLEYDFLVAPFADPKQIQLAFEGVDGIHVSGAGDLLLTTSAGSEIRHLRPRVYQQDGGRRIEVAGAYQILDRRQAAFTLASYDPRRALVIDPAVVTYTRFLAGSSSDVASAIALDASGNAYVTGTTVSPNFPVADAFESIEPGNADAFVTKLSGNGSIVFSTYFGGSGTDDGAGIAVDSTGVYITGDTLSSDFPGSRNLPVNGQSDVFVTKLSPAGNSWIYSHAFGGSGFDAGKAIAVDSSHAAYVTGYTGSPDFPMLGQWHPAFGGFLDAFVMKVDPQGNIVNTIFLGGSSTDIGYGITVDAGGSPWVTGQTCSNNFPLSGPATIVAGCNTFVTRVNNLFTGFMFSTQFGGGSDLGAGITADAAGYSYVTGTTNSVFGATPGAFQTSKPGPGASAFVTKLDDLGGRVYATYLGGTNGSTSGLAIALDRTGAIYVSGETSSTDLPGAPTITPNPTAGFYSKLTNSLNALDYTTFLGASIKGIAVYHPVSQFNIPPLIYTAGYRFSGGTGPQNQDAFVVQLNEPFVLTFQ